MCVRVCVCVCVRVCVCVHASARVCVNRVTVSKEISHNSIPIKGRWSELVQIHSCLLQ